MREICGYAETDTAAYPVAVPVRVPKPIKLVMEAGEILPYVNQPGESIRNCVVAPKREQSPSGNAGIYFQRVSLLKSSNFAESFLELPEMYLLSC